MRDTDILLAAAGGAMARPLCLHLAPGSEMEALLLLIPLSLLLMAIAAVALVWGVEHKQFDDLDRAALSVLEEPEGDES